MIKVEDLKFYYNMDTPLEKLALDGVSFEINRGDFLGVVGVSGSGKSTLAQHFNGLLKPYQGKIFIDGEDITEKKADFGTLRKKVGLVMQFPEDQLFEETVYQDVAYGVKNIGIPEHEIVERMYRLFGFLNLDLQKIYHRSPFNLSGGEKRKVALAGVFIMDPEIIVLDEPTAGLDPVSIKETVKYIKELKEKYNKTMVIVSHSMAVVSELCNKVLVMKNGKADFFGQTEDLLKDIDIFSRAGLLPPQITSLMHNLAKEGFNVKSNIYAVSDAVEEIVKI